MAMDVNELKRQVFFGMLDMAERVFISVGYGENVVVGKRGFLPQEKEKGLILVFNQSMHFTWDEEGISTTLVFGQTAEKCFIPQDNIMSVFSPELNAQFTVFPKEKDSEEESEKEITAGAKKSSPDEKVIKVDFRGRK